MLLNNLRRPVSTGLAIVDPVFPQKEPFAFRNTEITEYLERIDNCASFAMSPMKPDDGAWFGHGYGVSYKEFLKNKQGYLQYYPENGEKIRYLHEDRSYSFGLAYSYFLAETYVLLPFYEKHNIPFTFVLYPGGAFGLDNESSDGMLKKIFSSPYFRGVIVTQEITRRYLIGKDICPEEAITYIYGGFVQFRKNELKPKRYYKKEKQTLDICFVAAKYSERGVDKGYDLFVEVAKKLCAQTDDIMFHVVGGFDKDDIDVSDIAPRVKFYGYKRPDFLLNFYSSMDIFLGPGRPYQLYEGNFDEFPLGIDAGYCGVALFVCDELKMNRYYVQEDDIVLVPTEADVIVGKILIYRKDPDKLYKLAHKGQEKTQRLFDVDHQVNERISFFGKYTDLQVHGGNRD